MIQVNELRHNSYYLLNGKVEKYNILSYGQWDLKCYKPIPITPEILEKCGFNKELGWGENYFIKNIPIGLTKDDAGNYFLCARQPQFDMYGDCEDDYRAEPLPTKINSLHQLQNLYFALTGEELQVAL